VVIVVVVLIIIIVVVIVVIIRDTRGYNGHAGGDRVGWAAQGGVVLSVQ
jgi:preprotein translocase subunit SecG